MGFNIARYFANHRMGVTIYDLNPAMMDLSEKKMNKINKASGRDTYISHPRNLEAAIANADFVIESVSEDLEIKRNLYFRISPLLKNENVIVSSNTSTFALAELAAGLPFKTRMIITHFFNPAHLIPLVEIVKSEHTLITSVKRVIDLLTDSGKVPVILKADIKGFIANRLQVALLREACYLIDRGIADPYMIDTVVKESIGIRWALNGPFEILDHGGLDIWEKVLGNLLPVLDNTPRVSNIIEEKARLKNLGVKTGSGFYKYDLDTFNEQEEKREVALAYLLSAKKLK